jgi:hypothetical protein
MGRLPAAVHYSIHSAHELAAFAITGLVHHEADDTLPAHARCLGLWSALPQPRPQGSGGEGTTPGRICSPQL